MLSNKNNSKYFSWMFFYANFHFLAKEKTCKNIIRLQIVIFLQNTDRVQQDGIWQLKNVKIIYKFHKLVFDLGDSSLECFNRAREITSLINTIFHRKKK